MRRTLTVAAALAVVAAGAQAQTAAPRVEAHFGVLTNIAIILMAAANLLLFAGLAFLAIRLKSIVTGAVDEALGKVLPKVQPVLDNVAKITNQVSGIVENVAPKVQHIAEDAESTAHGVSTKVKTTTSLVTEGVAKPIVNIASVLTGVQKGLEVWNTAKENNGAADGKEAAATKATTAP